MMPPFVARRFARKLESADAHRRLQTQSEDLRLLAMAGAQPHSLHFTQSVFKVKKNQFPQTFFKLIFILVIVKDKVTDMWESFLL